jgi:quinol monooxygenase YgiN
MITMTIVVKVKPEKRGEFLQAIRSLNNNDDAADRGKPQGLTRSRLYQEMDDRSGFSLIYEWETQEDLDVYFNSEQFRVLLGALKVLGEKSEIKWSRVPEHESNGLKGETLRIERG